MGNGGAPHHDDGGSLSGDGSGDWDNNNILAQATSSEDCLVLQKALKSADSAAVDNCYLALEPHLVALAQHQDGNKALQSLLRRCTEVQLARALPRLFQVETVIELCCDPYSNHVLQQYLNVAPAYLLELAVNVFCAQNHEDLLRVACNRIGNRE